MQRAASDCTQPGGTHCPDDPHEHSGNRHPAHQPVHAFVRQRSGRICHHELIKLVVPVFVPAIFSLYFDLFDGLIQTYVFVFLTSLFMKETME